MDITKQLTKKTLAKTVMSTIPIRIQKQNPDVSISLHTDISRDGGDEIERVIEKTKLTKFEMVKQYMRLAISTVTTCTLNCFSLLICTIFAGNLNDASKLAGVGLATTVSHLICNYALYGLNGALDTLVS